MMFLMSALPWQFYINPLLTGLLELWWCNVSYFPRVLAWCDDGWWAVAGHPPLV